MPETPLETSVHSPIPRTAASRPRRSFGSRLSQSAKSWARNSFGREQIIASLKSLAWVAPMTVIIWIYAEREQTSKQTVQFHVEARNNDPTRLVELNGIGSDGRITTDFNVRADLTGPNANLEDMKKKLEGGGGLQVEIPEFAPGHHQVPLASILINDPEFVHAGLTPTGIVPSQIDVFIDRIDIDRKVPVRVRSNVANLDGSPIFHPATIEVTGPKSVLDAARAEGKLVAYVDLPTTGDPGPRSVPNSPLNIPINDPRVHFSATSVAADYTLKSPNVEGTLRGVPVLISYPAGDLWDKYKAVLDSPTLSDVKVIGPADVITSVNQPEYPNKPKAFLDLSKANLGDAPVSGSTHEAPLLFEFGSTGLKVSPDFAKTLSFKVVER